MRRWSVPALATALAFRVVPEACRLDAARWLARRLEPLIARTAVYRDRCTLRTESLRAWTLGLVLMSLTRYGTTFDPRIRLEGGECLPAPGTGPLLLVAPHLMLSMVFIRVFVERGYDPLVIAADPALRAAGTRTSPRLLRPSRALFFEARRAFERGELVATMIDRGEPHPRTRAYPTAGGPLLVSDALVRLAVRLGVPVVFMGTTLEGSTIVSRVAAPALGSTTAREIVDDFARFTDDLSRATSASTRW
jgi:hypothetical protein